MTLPPGFQLEPQYKSAPFATLLLATRTLCWPTTMPAQISSILDGPAGPPPPSPAIDKPSLRRLADTIAGLPDARIASLVDVLVAAGIPEVSALLSSSAAAEPGQRDATLSLDLEALPVRVYRKVWLCVFDPTAPEPATASRRVVVADVRDGSDSPVPKREASVVPRPKYIPVRTSYMAWGID